MEWIEQNFVNWLTRALEAGNAAWLSHKLPGLDFGRSYNIALCGYRFFTPNRHMENAFVYVSFEMIKGACLCALSQLFI
jgi:hypothetical protein